VNVLTAAHELPPGARPVCVGIGVFDGVHLGHQQVIRQTLADAHQLGGVAVVLTFDRHPNTVVAPDRVPPMLYSLPQKLRTLAALGVAHTLLLPFDRAFSQQTGEQFIRNLAQGFGRLGSICVGREFTFGHKRSGNVALLQQLGAELGFTVHGLAALASGSAAGSQMLGRAYALAGRVQRGDQLVRHLGFPTANLDVTGLALPPQGVYAVRARLGERELRGALNLGVRPTLASPTPVPRCEVHLLDFAEEIYGAELEVTFVTKLRGEQKFPSLAVLREQIQADVAAARQLLA